MRRNVIVSRQTTARIMGLLLVSAAIPAFALALQEPAFAAPPASAQHASSTGFRQGTEISEPSNAATNPLSILIGVACTGRGECSAGGSYTDVDGNGQAMAVTQSRGRWARAVEIRLPANVAATPYAQINGVACTSAGSCVAVGYYRTTAG